VTEPRRPAFHQSSLVNLTVSEERLHRFGRVVTPAFPSVVVTLGRSIRSGGGPHCDIDHSPVDWSTYPLKPPAPSQRSADLAKQFVVFCEQVSGWCRETGGLESLTVEEKELQWACG
jgi:hypothetical protein